MNRRMIVLACILTFMTGCLSLPVANCVVQGKKCIPEWEEDQMVNNYGMWSNIHTIHPAEYYVSVGGNDSHGNWTTFTYFVSSNQYYSVNVGKPWPYHM